MENFYSLLLLEINWTEEPIIPAVRVKAEAAPAISIHFDSDFLLSTDDSLQYIALLLRMPVTLDHQPMSHPACALFSWQATIAFTPRKNYAFFTVPKK
jgi:hypothetical protein